MNISDEAVEAAAKIMFEHKDLNVTFGEVARAALEAAAPHLIRSAQEVAWAKGATSAGMNLMALQAAGINPNPYRNAGAGE